MATKRVELIAYDYVLNLNISPGKVEHIDGQVHLLDRPHIGEEVFANGGYRRIEAIRHIAQGLLLFLSDEMTLPLT